MDIPKSKLNDNIVPMTYVMSATIMMATTVESHTPLLKGSRKERRLGGAFRVMLMIVIVIIVKTVIMMVMVMITFRGLM